MGRPSLVDFRYGTPEEAIAALEVTDATNAELRAALQNLFTLFIELETQVVRLQDQMPDT